MPDPPLLLKTSSALHSYKNVFTVVQPSATTTLPFLNERFSFALLPCRLRFCLQIFWVNKQKMENQGTRGLLQKNHTQSDKHDVQGLQAPF